MVSNTQTDTLFWVFCCSSCAICACQYKVQTVSVWHHPPVVYLCFWRALPLLGVLSLKFPEAPTVKSTCLFFVSAHTHTLTKPCNNMHFYMSHLASSVLIVCVCAVDWAVTPLLRRASGGKSGAGGREAVDPGRAGGEKTELHSCTSHHGNISSSHQTLCCVIAHQTFLPLLVVIKSLLSNFSLHSLQGIGGGATRSLMDQFAEVLFSLNKHCFSLLAVWLKEALQPPGFPSSRVTTEQKDNFSHQILR